MAQHLILSNNEEHHLLRGDSGALLDGHGAIERRRRGLVTAALSALAITGAAAVSFAALRRTGVGAGSLLTPAGAIGLSTSNHSNNHSVNASNSSKAGDNTSELRGATGKHKHHKGNSSGSSKKNEPWKTRRGSFIAIGDWGYDEKVHYINLNNKTCVTSIAEKMDKWMKLLGDVKFVINVGDSFYPSGVSSKADPQWQEKWRDVFSKEVRSVPWYSVYGNHDYHQDPCACSDNISECAQINRDEKNLDYFVMPNYTYYKEVPELDMEIIGLDLNRFFPGWDKKKTLNELGADCEWSPCKDKCWFHTNQRSGASFDLFWDRHEKSKAKNHLVFSHYPTDYFLGGAPEFLDGLRDNSKHDIVYFGGHRHSTDQWSTASIEPNQNWVVGGGGGYSCDSDNQGFVVGEINEDYSIKTYPVYVDKELCCIKPTTTSTKKPVWY